LALGERENDAGAREYGTCEYGGTRECGAREYGACEYAGVCEDGVREDLVREYDRESYSQNAFKTGHFALATERAPSTWIIDSGASHHMFNGPQSWFRTYSRLSHTINIRLGDDTIVQATHKGLVQVQGHWVKALHLPTFRYSLLSVGDLDTHGYRTTFEKGRCIISDPANQRMIMLGRKNGMLYELDAGSSVPEHTALITSTGPAKLSIAESRMWHRRLGHPGEAAIKSIVSGYVDDGNVCEVCIQAKLRRKIVRIPVQRTTTPFELVHSDLCGPFAVRSSGGAQYFIVYIDDYSRHTELAVLPDKRAETCTAAFQWFQAKIDGWGYDIRRFRSDNGSGEYNNKMFRSILAA
jgi:hypothetical protein